MKLRSSPSSPFGRKVKLAAKILGVIDQIEITRANTSDPADSIKDENPLAKIPALILDDGTVLYDSRVICEYLDALAGGGKLFPSGEQRWKVLTLQALCDGILDAAILQVYESRFRPEDMRVESWVERQQDKVTRALDWLEANTPKPGTANIGDICLACSLGYLDFRFGDGWRQGRGNLVAWLDAFAEANPAYGETIPSD